MEVREIRLTDVDVSQFNTRKDLADGQYDSTIEDLANSIARQGLLSPITVYQKADGRYSVIAGQRRFLAFQHLKKETIPAVVRQGVGDIDATAISLVENLHRADMNPRDKARAFRTLLDKSADIQSVSRETGVGVSTIRKYIQLLDLAESLQEKLAAGEVKNTEALARLARQFKDPDKQVDVWDRIGGFTQDVQGEIIKRLDGELGNLDDLVEDALEGEFRIQTIRNCPFDCPTIPATIKADVARMIQKEQRE